MKFACPQKSHNITFSTAWDYLCHLQKCHLINRFLKDYGETRNEFYFCASCLQVFELVTERDQHQSKCKIDNFKLIFKDVNKSVPLGKNGQKKIQELLQHYKELLWSKKNNLLNQMQFIQENQLEITSTTDPRLYIPKVGIEQLKGNQIQKVTKLIFNLLGGYERMEAAYYKLFRNQALESIAKDYPFKITNDSFKQFCQKNKIEINKQLLLETRVCEFCEMKINKNPEIYLQIIQTNRSKSIWIMIPEGQNPVPEFEFDEPWCIFNIMTDQLIEHKQLDQLQEKPKNDLIIKLEQQLQKEEEKSLVLQSKVQQSFCDLDQTLNLVQQMELKIDNQGRKLFGFQVKVREIDQDNQNIIKKYNELTIQKLEEAESNLKSFFSKQFEIEKQKKTLNATHKVTDIDPIKKKNTLKAKVLQLDKDRDCLVGTINHLKQEIQITQKSIEDKIAKASQAKKKIQMIKQLLCISCKIKERAVMQFPCQHFLFCEDCFLKNLDCKGFKCPLQNLLKCQNADLSTKYKIIKIASFD